MTDTKFKPGQKKRGGRTKGTPNKSTVQVKTAILNAFEEVGGEPGLRPHPVWRQQVGILQLVRIPAEVLHLHPALIHQRLEAIVQPAQADAQLLGHLALGDIRLVLQQAQDLEVLFGSGHGLIRG